MSLSKPKEEERKTPAQWLKEGYVVRPNAEGKQVFYFKVNKWITVYSKKEVTREKRAVAKVEAELKKKRNAKQKLYRLYKKYCKEVESQDYYLFGVKFLTDEYESERVYDFIARNKEEWDSIEVGTVLPYNDEQIEVVAKWQGRLYYNDTTYPKRKTLALKYKYLDGTLVDQPKKFVIPTDENQPS